MSRILLVTGVLWVGAAPLAGSPFYLRYDADETFPEQQGWGRYWGDPDDKLIRSVENGVFRLDTRGSYAIFDLYEIISAAFILEPGEELQLAWRMRTLETSGSWGRSDVVLGIVNESHAYVELFVGPDFVSEDEEFGGEPEHLYALDAESAHTYHLTTSNMEEYELYVDGVLAFHGGFHDYAWRPAPRVTFGDAITGRTSLSEWEYVEVAVIPEPEAGAALLLGLGLLAWRSPT
jgi:hypothetical protein